MLKPSLFVLMLLAGAVAAADLRPVPKPAAPIAITLEPVGAVTGPVVEFRANATSGIDSAELAIDVQVPSEALVVSGDLHWRGPLSAGAGKQLLFTLRFPDTGGTVHALASLIDPALGRFAARASYAVGRAAAAKARVPQGALSTRQGRRIIEYRVP